jgi:outer membrane protein assembly factor BamB
MVTHHAASTATDIRPRGSRRQAGRSGVFRGFFIVRASLLAAANRTTIVGSVHELSGSRPIPQPKEVPEMTRPCAHPPALLISVGFVAACLLSAGVLAADAEQRTWTSADGQHTTKATFVDYRDQTVVLRGDNGSELRVPIQQLSYEDRRYIRGELRRRGESEAAAEASSTASSATAPSHTTNWPRWRGPQVDGKSLETGLMTSWPDAGPPLLWQGQGVGNGYAGVAVVGDRIFTMGRRSGTEFLHALRTENGEILWSTPLGPGQNQKGSNCTPTIDEDRVYALSIEGDLICVEAASGQPVWKTNLIQDFGGKMMSGWGFSESPLIDGDLLLCTPGAANAIMAALDKRSGRVVWTTKMPYGGQRGKDGAGYSSIVISRAAGIKQYVQLVGRGLIGVDAATGRLLWRYDRIANGTANITTPIVHGDYVFCSTGYGTGSALLKLTRSRDGVRAEEQYFLDDNTLQNHHGGLILLDGFLYGGHGHNNGFPICVQLETGQVKWGGKIRGPGKESAAVAYADGHLYFRYQDGIMALIEATPEEYRLKSSFKLASVRAQSWPHPVISNGRLYIRDQDVLLCYDIRADEPE